MANSFGQFTGWVSVSHVLKSEPNCTSHKPRASFQRWQVHRGLVHGIYPHAATQSYMLRFIYIGLDSPRILMIFEGKHWLPFCQNSFIEVISSSVKSSSKQSSTPQWPNLSPTSSNFFLKTLICIKENPNNVTPCHLLKRSSCSPNMRSNHGIDLFCIFLLKLFLMAI